MNVTQLEEMAASIQVVPLDSKKLSAFVKSLLQHEQDCWYECREQAILTDYKIMTDAEAIIQPSRSVLHLDGAVGESYKVGFRKEGVEPSGAIYSWIIPEFVIWLTRERLLKEFALLPISLTEFIGNRFLYNHRIGSNIYTLYSIINDKKPSTP